MDENQIMRKLTPQGADPSKMTRVIDPIPPTKTSKNTTCPDKVRVQMDSLKTKQNPKYRI